MAYFFTLLCYYSMQNEFLWKSILCSDVIWNNIPILKADLLQYHYYKIV